jgi:glycosyltransferase involved in cell wall biosynthesis
MRGVPVVSLHVNPDRVLDHEAVGIHTGSEEQLGRAVRLLLADEALRTAYASRARDYAVRSHSMQNAQKLVELIDSCAVSAKLE